MPNLVTCHNWIPIFEWYVVRCDPKTKYQNDMCIKETRLCAQNMITILGSIVNIIWGLGDLYDHLMSMRIFTLKMNKIFI